MPTSKQQQMDIEKRRLIVMSNILAGLNYRDIASQLNVSLGTISRDVKAVINRLKKEQVLEAEQAILVDLRRIDVALHSIWDDVKAGKLLAIDRMIKLMERRAKMLGYDEQTLNLNVSGGVDIEAIRDQRWQAVSGALLEALSDDQEQELESEDTENDDN
jgi:hypothetical protein